MRVSVPIYIARQNAIKGDAIKSGPGVKSSNFSANIRPTETYYIPNQWKLIKVFAELCRFEIAALPQCKVHACSCLKSAWILL